MKYVILPRNAAATEQEEVSDAQLGGYFYDYLQTADGKTVGVSYWILEALRFEEHPVYSQFLGDARFCFDPMNRYVDMVFDERHAALLQSGQLTTDVVQEFGGESIVKCGQQFGIVFILPGEI
jgi:hypothetical protein